MNLNTENPELLKLSTEQLHIYILGGIKLSGLDRLRVTLKIEATNNYPLRYNLDLYNSDGVEKLIRRTAEHFELELKDVRTIIMVLTEQLESYRLSMLNKNTPNILPKIEPTEQQKQEAITYLKQKNLIQKISEDIQNTGIIGEETNRLILYVVYTSRKLSHPLHIITFGNSGTGKSHLQEKVAALIPDEDKIEITSLTQNSLYYFEEMELDGKLILIEDLDGASAEALYAIRELQSKQKLSKTFSKKDNSGKFKSQTTTVHGRVATAATSTKDFVYEDNSNRSIIIHVDSSKQQDQKIMEFQRLKSSGEIDLQAQNKLIELLKNCQRVLSPIEIKNPYAAHLKLPEQVPNPRRTMSIYLNFIAAIAYLHQYQRTANNNAINVEISDIQLANQLLTEVFIRKSDELSTPARSSYEKIQQYLNQNNKNSFFTKELKAILKLNPSNLKRHLKELENYSYLKVISGSRYIGYEYKINLQEHYRQLKQEVMLHFQKQLAHLKTLKTAKNS